MWIFGRGSVDKQQVGSFFPHSDVTFFFSSGEEGAGKKGTSDTWWHFCLVRFLVLPSPLQAACILSTLHMAWFACSSCHGFVSEGGCRSDVFYKSDCIYLCFLVFTGSNNYVYNWNLASFFLTGEDYWPLHPLRRAALLKCFSLTWSITMGCISSASLTPHLLKSHTDLILCFNYRKFGT